MKSKESIKGNYKKPCKCGCGQLVWHKDSCYHIRDFLPGHYAKLNPNFDNLGKGNVFEKNNTLGVKKGQTRELCPSWKGGRRKHITGYWMIYKPEHHFATYGYVFEHRLIWEDEHNACLLPHGIVHHKDENPENNIWYNLQAMMRHEHPSYHRQVYNINKYRVS